MEMTVGRCNERLVTVRDLRTAVEGVIKDKEIVSPLPGLNAG